MKKTPKAIKENKNSSILQPTKSQPKANPTLKAVISQKVNSLITLRKQHQKRIDKLLTIKHETYHSSFNGLQGEAYLERDRSLNCSQMLKNFENDDDLVGQNEEELAGVNLLANVGFKTQLELPPMEEEIGLLHASILDQYPDCQLVMPKQRLLCQPSSKNQSFCDLVCFLNEQQYWQGIFVQKKMYNEQGKAINDYYGMRFRGGAYEEVLLSKEEIKKEEEMFLLIDEQDSSIDIRALLLRRLVCFDRKERGLGEFLNILFSYPIKKISINDTKSFLEMTSILPRIQSEDFVLFGKNKRTQHSSLIELPKTFSSSKYCQILHKYNQVSILIASELQVKKMQLKCLCNHFVVLSMGVSVAGRYYLQAGCEEDNNRMMRICVLDGAFKIVYQSVEKCGNFVMVDLEEDCYEVYISPVPDHSVSMKGEDARVEESLELVTSKQQKQPETFMFWVQGQSLITSHSQIQIQLKLLESYNSYTTKILKQFIIQTKKPTLMHKNSEYMVMNNQAISEQVEDEDCIIEGHQIVVQRYVTDLMDQTCLDVFEGASCGKYFARYEKYALCDVNCGREVIQIDFQQSQRVQVPVYANRALVGLTKAGQKVSHQLFYNFV